MIFLSIDLNTEKHKGLYYSSLIYLGNTTTNKTIKLLILMVSDDPL